MLGPGTTLVARLEAGTFYAKTRQPKWNDRNAAFEILCAELERLVGTEADTSDSFAAALQWTSGECTRMVNETFDACADPNVKVCTSALRCVTCKLRPRTPEAPRPALRFGAPRKTS